MDNPANAPLTKTETIGLVTIGKTTYEVARLAVGDAARNAGILNQFGLTGPRGATFMVIDYGPRFMLNAFAVGRRCSPRPMRGITREHLSAFGVAGEGR